MALNHSVKGSVTYSIVGTPNIVNGVVSGFNSNSGLSLPQITASVGTPFDIQVVFTTWPVSRQTNNDLLCSTSSVGSYTCRLFVIGGKLNFRTTYNSAGNNLEINYSLEADTKYKARFVYNGSILNGYLFDNNDTLLGSNSVTRTDISIAGTSSLMIGYNNVASYCEGSIDLKETYISLNGQAWFGVCPIEVKHIEYGSSVGYTEVGSTTISNGIASDFSSNNYLQTTSVVSANNGTSFEINYKFTTMDMSVGGNKHLLCCQSPVSGVGYWFRLWFLSNKLRFTYRLSDLTEDYVDISNYTTTNNTTYSAKVVYDGTNINIYQYDENNTLLDSSTKALSSAIFMNSAAAGVTRIGQGTSTSYFNGSIDLNNTYIKINGKLWFYKPCTNYLIKDGKLVFADSDLYLSGPNTYEKVGNPVIVDNIISGFSANNYLQTPAFPFGDNSFEVYTKIHINTLPTESTGVLSPQALHNGLTLGKYEQSATGFRLGFYTFNQTDSNPVVLYPAIDAQSNTDYYAKFGWDKTQYWIEVSEDGTNWTRASRQSTVVPLETDKPFLFGNTSYYGRIFDGSIDLNNTSIKLNDTLWLYGKNYASKNIAPVPSGFRYGNITTDAIGYVDIPTQVFTAAPSGAIFSGDISNTPITLTWLSGANDSYTYAVMNGDSSSAVAATSFEYITRYTTPASEEQATNPVLIGAQAAQHDTYTPVLWFNESHYLGLLSSYSTSSQAWNIILAADNKLDFNTTYDIKASFDGSKYTIAYKKVSDSAWTSKSVADNTSAHFQYMPRVLSGPVGSSYSQGILCITKTKITKNGVVLFDGLTATESDTQSTSSVYQNTYYNNGCTVTTTTE